MARKSGVSFWKIFYACAYYDEEVSNKGNVYHVMCNIFVNNKGDYCPEHLEKLLKGKQTSIDAPESKTPVEVDGGLFGSRID